MKQKDLAQPVTETKRTRTLGDLTWYRCVEGSAEVAPVQAVPFEDVLAAEAWLKKALTDGLSGGAFELHRVVKKVAPRAVVVPQRFEW